jgi:hypothetical protein
VALAQPCVARDGAIERRGRLEFAHPDPDVVDDAATARVGVVDRPALLPSGSLKKAR